MARRIQAFFGNRNRVDHMNAMARGNHRRRGVRSSKRARGMPRNEQLPFVPPEAWHEPREERSGYRIVVQTPGIGYRHIVTPEEVRARLSELPASFVAPLQTVQLSQMTRKKLSFPCYGMQWGATIYLYPVEEGLVERFDAPPTPAQRIEAKMYGGSWEESAAGGWSLVWTEATLKDFYLNNILIHELGHLLDERNTRSVDRERYAEWFALQYGYKPSRRLMGQHEVATVQRHHKPRQPR